MTKYQDPHSMDTSPSSILILTSFSIYATSACRNHRKEDTVKQRRRKIKRKESPLNRHNIVRTE